MQNYDKRRDMKDRYIIILAIATVALILTFTSFGKSEVKVYDCGMAEWHPDIPNAVKEECRKLRREINDSAERYRT